MRLPLACTETLLESRISLNREPSTVNEENTCVNKFSTKCSEQLRSRGADSDRRGASRPPSQSASQSASQSDTRPSSEVCKSELRSCALRGVCLASQFVQVSEGQFQSHRVCLKVRTRICLPSDADGRSVNQRKRSSVCLSTGGSVDLVNSPVSEQIPDIRRR